MTAKSPRTSHIRDQLGRGSTADDHGKLLSLVTLILGPTYLARAFNEYGRAHAFTEPAILMGLFGLLMIALSHGARHPKNYSLLAQIIAYTILLTEARLVMIQFIDFSEAFFLFPLCIIFTSLLSNIRSGLLLSAVSIVLGIFVLHHEGAEGTLYNIRESFPEFTNRFLAYLVFSQLIIAIVAHFFQDNLERSVEEIKVRRRFRFKATRRAALSETMGKAAHEINNPLAILDSALLMLKRAEHTSSMPPSDQCLVFMRNAFDRLQNVVNTIRTFSAHEMHEEVERIPITTLLAALDEQTHETVRSHGIHLALENRTENREIRCRPQQILFVLKVLIENAIDAMQGSPLTVDIRIFDDQDKVRFEIENPAKELTEEIADKIFTPFFTTKPIGQSLGMNLSICRVLIEEQNGTMGFSRKIESTIFWFEIPLNPPVTDLS